MDEERWERLDAILEAALERAPEERRAFLFEACGPDRELLLEAEKLVVLAEREGDRLRPSGVFDGSFGIEVAQELAREEGRQVGVGRELGPYRILRFLGRGGMGQVFAAEDTKLGRVVALKVLPPEIASPERRRRFEGEAKAIASLNHPNIVHLYTIEEINGVAFITMELVDGSTLAELIPEGGLGTKRFFELALPLIAALSAAHERGVVHRDVKPGNVMLARDGLVKVLDFGLAKRRVNRTDPLRKLTETDTEEGLVVGTVSYMSPEQAEGKPIDHRTDIFSLGIVLYEMLTGRAPFTGDTPAAILSSLLRDTPPPPQELNPRLPSALGRVIRRCLAKEPDGRYQTARDVAIELEEIEYELSSRKLFQSAVERRDRRRPLLVGLTLVTLLALGLGRYALEKRQEPPFELLSGRFTQLTTEPGAEISPSLSPDGTFLVYSSRVSGNADIYLLRASGRRPINLTEGSPDDDTLPAFSPDGDYIAFHSSRQGGGLFIMGSTGEFARHVAEGGWNPSWSPDGVSIVYATSPITRTPFDRPSRSELWTVRTESGETRRLFEGDAVQPSWSPHGHRIAFWALSETGGERNIFTLPSDGGEPVPVTRDGYVDWSPVWSPDGRYIYFSSDRGGSMNLWRVAVDERSGEVLGDPEPIRAPASFATHISFSRDGERMAYASTLVSLSLARAPFDPRTGRAGPLERQARDVRDVAAPRVSPDGSWIAYQREGRQEDILLVRPDGTEERLVTDDAARDRFPRWSPDGSRIAFYSNRSGSYEIWTVRADGSEPTQLTDIPGEPMRYPTWSPDGTRLMFGSPGQPGYIIDPSRPFSEQTLEALPPYPGENEEFVSFDWSPDGRWVAGYVLSRQGVRAGLAIYDLETERYQKLTEFGLFPLWLADSRRLLFQGLGPDRSLGQYHFELDYKLFLLDRVTGKVDEVLALSDASAENPTLAPDERTLYFVRSTYEADIWMLSVGDETGSGSD